jgi:riboflavin-specific deaminase-like protein
MRKKQKRAKLRRKVSNVRPERSARRPFVFINMAISADGKIATSNRALSSFGSARDREHVFELRARADAVMAGARTVDSGPVALGPGPARWRRLRLRRGLSEYNLRIVVSRSGSVDPRARIFRRKFSSIILLTTGRAQARRLAALRRQVEEVKICGFNEINFPEALRWLRKKWKVERLLCEGGGELNDALFQAGLVDELHLTVCPKIFGGRDAPTIADAYGASSLAAAARFELQSARRCGDELFLVYQRCKK